MMALLYFIKCSRKTVPLRAIAEEVSREHAAETNIRRGDSELYALFLAYSAICGGGSLRKEVVAKFDPNRLYSQSTLWLLTQILLPRNLETGSLSAVANDAMLSFVQSLCRNEHPVEAVLVFQASRTSLSPELLMSLAYKACHLLAQDQELENLVGFAGVPFQVVERAVSSHYFEASQMMEAVKHKILAEDFEEAFDLFLDTQTVGLLGLLREPEASNRLFQYFYSRAFMQFKLSTSRPIFHLFVIYLDFVEMLSSKEIELENIRVFIKEIFLKAGGGTFEGNPNEIKLVEFIVNDVMEKVLTVNYTSEEGESIRTLNDNQIEEIASSAGLKQLLNFDYLRTAMLIEQIGWDQFNSN